MEKESSLPKYCQCMSNADKLFLGKKRKYLKYETRPDRRANKNARIILERKRKAEGNAKISSEETDILRLPMKEFGICSILAKRLDAEVEEENRSWDALVPECSYSWTEDDVAKWIRELGFPQYQEAMKVNFVTGRKLIYLDANNLCKMGIRDFEHIKIITASVREMLKIKPECYNRSVALPPQEPMALYLQQKWKTGKKNNALTYHKFLREHELHPNDP